MDDFAQTLQGPISADKYGFIHVGSVNSGLLCNGTAVMSADLQRNFGIRGFRENPRGQKLICKNYPYDLFWPLCQWEDRFESSKLGTLCFTWFSPVRTHCVAFAIRLLKGLGLQVFLVLASQSTHVTYFTFTLTIMQF